MKNKNDQTSPDDKNENIITHQGEGPQGVDKAPGDVTSEENVQFTQQTQKGKKVDGDPSKESDQPSEQNFDN